VVLFLHGLLGNGKNLRAPAKRLVQAHPHLSALLLDIRGHGSSAAVSFSPPHTLHSAAQDIAQTLSHLRLNSSNTALVGVIGHSFGGRLALQYVQDSLKQHCASNSNNGSTDVIISPPKGLWLLDTYPNVANQTVANVLAAISRVPLPIESKSDLVSFLTQKHNIDAATAAWMTTNLIKDTGGFRFKFDLPVILDLIDDCKRQDYFETLKDIRDLSAASCQVNLVQAGRNDAWKNTAVSEMLAKAEGVGEVKVHLLPNAGHWVHVDDLDGLMNLIEPSFSKE